VTTGHTPDTPRGQGRRLSGSIRAAWALVLGMLLTATAWSVSGQLHHWGMPPLFAIPLSVMFDAAGLICATYARRAVERGTPAGLSRLSILLFVAIAGVLNWNHGQQLGGTPAAVGFASLSGGVELLFELHRRDVRDEQRAARGLIAERLPHIPVMGWVMYPSRSWQTLRDAVGVRLDLLDPVQRGILSAPDTDTRPDKRGVPTIRAAVHAAADTFPDATAEDIVEHLSAAGIDTDEDTVRHVLHGHPDTEDSRPEPSRVRPMAPAGQTIADSIRTALASGITAPPAVLAYVRKIHGQGVSADTVSRTRRRIEREAS
jgi:hypothetical protein